MPRGFERGPRWTLPRGWVVRGHGEGGGDDRCPAGLGGRDPPRGDFLGPSRHPGSAAACKEVIAARGTSGWAASTRSRGGMRVGTFPGTSCTGIMADMAGSLGVAKLGGSSSAALRRARWPCVPAFEVGTSAICPGRWETDPAERSGRPISNPATRLSSRCSTGRMWRGPCHCPIMVFGMHVQGYAMMCPREARQARWRDFAPVGLSRERPSISRRVSSVVPPRTHNAWLSAFGAVWEPTGRAGHLLGKSHVLVGTGTVLGPPDPAHVPPGGGTTAHGRERPRMRRRSERRAVPPCRGVRGRP